MIIRQLLDPGSGTFTYLLADPQTRDAVLVDPVREQVDRDVALLRELGLTLAYAVETHLSCDHVTGSGALRARLGAQVVVPAGADAARADRGLGDGDTLEFGRQALEVRAVPGHCAAAIALVTADGSAVFTGQALLVRQAPRLDMPGADPARLRESVHDKLFTLHAGTVVWPGAVTAGYTSSTIAEERAFNPYLGAEITREQFLRALEARALPAPRPDRAEVLALNEKLGLDDKHLEQAGERRWAPIRRTATGIPEVTVDWVRDEGTRYHLVDVRGPQEFTGELGHVPGSELVPLDRLADLAHAWNRRAAVVTICRSGGRSGMAAGILERMGFQRVASMRGGMMAWRQADLPVER